MWVLRSVTAYFNRILFSVIQSLKKKDSLLLSSPLNAKVLPQIFGTKVQFVDNNTGVNTHDRLHTCSFVGGNILLLLKSSRMKMHTFAILHYSYTSSEYTCGLFY